MFVPPRLLDLQKFRHLTYEALATAIFKVGLTTVRFGFEGTPIELKIRSRVKRSERKPLR